MNDRKQTTHNFKAFIWHAVFLALAQKFMDVNTVIPTMLLQAGGTPFHLGILTAIMVGGNGFMGIFFASFLTHRERKKNYLLVGINLRVAALLIMGFILGSMENLKGGYLIAAILLLMALFSFSGAFAGISYTDILGRAIDSNTRKRFFIHRQALASIGILLSAILARKTLTLFAYPKNYSILFFIAGGLLLTATLGFWLIREDPLIVKEKPSFKKRIGLLKTAFAGDRNLRQFLYLCNTVNLGLAMIPFLIAYSKKQFGLTSADTGNFLLLQVGGMVVSTVIFRFASKSQKYKGILAMFILTGALLPVAALMLSNHSVLYLGLFFLSGIVLAARQISLPGMLLEISNIENRTIYTGLFGLGSLSVLIYPVIAGIIVQHFGYTFIFIATSLIILCSFFFSRKVVCPRTST